MSDLLANDTHRVISGRISHPRTGAWFGEVTLEGEIVLAEDDKFSVSDGGYDFEFQGRVIRSAVVHGRTQVRFGGATALRTRLRPRFYKDVPLPARLVFDDILSDCGLARSSVANASFLERDLKTWTRKEATGAEAIEAVCEAVGCVWRASPYDNAFEVFETDVWQPATTDADVIEENTQTGIVTLGLERPDSIRLYPGQNLSYGLEGRSGKISLVEHLFGENETRVRLTFEKGTSQKDRLSTALKTLVTRNAPLDYFALYPSTLVTQDTDNTLQIRPDDERLPSMAGVPLRLPVPGAVIKVTDGARVLLGFESGSPSKPVALLWELGTAKSVEITTASGAKVSLGETGDVRINTTGSVNIAAAGDSTNGHQHTVTGTAGPYPIASGIAVTATDTIAAVPARKSYV